jgi:hypothetical protein
MCPELCIPRQLRGLEGDCGSGIGQLQLHRSPTGRMKITMQRRCFLCVCVCASAYVPVCAHCVWTEISWVLNAIQNYKTVGLSDLQCRGRNVSLCYSISHPKGNLCGTFVGYSPNAHLRWSQLTPWRKIVGRCRFRFSQRGGTKQPQFT